MRLRISLSFFPFSVETIPRYLNIYLNLASVICNLHIEFFLRFMFNSFFLHCFTTICRYYFMGLLTVLCHLYSVCCYYCGCEKWIIEGPLMISESPCCFGWISPVETHILALRTFPYLYIWWTNYQSLCRWIVIIIGPWIF